MSHLGRRSLCCLEARLVGPSGSTAGGFHMKGMSMYVKEKTFLCTINSARRLLRTLQEYYSITSFRLPSFLSNREDRW